MREEGGECQCVRVFANVCVCLCVYLFVNVCFVSVFLLAFMRVCVFLCAMCVRLYESEMPVCVGRTRTHQKEMSIFFEGSVIHMALPSGDDLHDLGPTPLLWSDPVGARQRRARALRRRAPLGSGVLRVARRGSGAKTPPLAARPKNQGRAQDRCSPSQMVGHNAGRFGADLPCCH